MRWILALVLVVGFGVASAGAGWIDLPGVNLPVATGLGIEIETRVVDDGAGGAIILWQDYRTGEWDIYAHRVLASGLLDPAWPPGGRALCTAGGYQTTTAIAGDGAGGAIVVWQDTRGGATDIYAQHVLASGLVDPTWPADGRALCTAPSDQVLPTIVSDDAGGAIVAWHDYRSGTSSDIYAQHVTASGVVDPAWPLDGRPLCTATNYQLYPKIVADLSGGAVVTWQDYRSSSNYDIYAQHVLATGAVDPAWPADGRALCTAANIQENPRIVGDGTGGAIVAWQDYRSGSNYDVYAQRVLATGAVDPAWPANGRDVRTGSPNQMVSTIVPDGSGGAIVAWHVSGIGTIEAQRVLTTGALDPTWPTNGCMLRGSTNGLSNLLAVTDGAGGVILAWHENPLGLTLDLYAHHVLASGVPDPTWPRDGRVLSTATGSQYLPAIAIDGAGGALVAWQDDRSTNVDIYAQRVTTDGHFGDISPLPSIAGVRDTPNDQGGQLKLMWNASPVDPAPYRLVAAYTIWRSVPPNLAQAALASGTRLVGADEPLSLEGTRSIRATPTASGIIYWELVGSQIARGFEGYSMVVSTIGDSVADSNPYTLFMVSAGSVNGVFLDSAPDSGYSVDNLAPLQPTPFAAAVVSGGVALHWNPNREFDLAGYRLYRGDEPGFTPGPSNHVTSKPDTGYVDQAGPGGGYYKLAAVDIHGNVSPYATVSIDLPTTTLMSLASMEVSAGSVRLTWQALAYPGTAWTLQRRAHDAGWEDLEEATSDARGLVTFEDAAVEAGERYDYRVRGMVAGQEVLSPEVAVTVPEMSFALEPVSPNPHAGTKVTVWFTLPEAAPARLELFDVSGRSIATRDVGALGAGRHAVQFETGGLGVGMHFVRLTQGARTSMHRVAFIR